MTEQLELSRMGFPLPFALCPLPFALPSCLHSLEAREVSNRAIAAGAESIVRCRRCGTVDRSSFRVVVPGRLSFVIPAAVSNCLQISQAAVIPVSAKDNGGTAEVRGSSLEVRRCRQHRSLSSFFLVPAGSAALPRYPLALTSLALPA